MIRAGLRSVSHARRLLPMFAVLSLVTSPAPGAAAPADVTIEGVVRDTSSAVVADARVEALVADRVTASAATNAEGRYRLDIQTNVPFLLRVTKPGFADEIVELPGTAAPVTREIVLRVGVVSDTLVVTASRAPESRVSLTQPVSVATKADMEALGSASLADVMRFVPGVNIEASGREGALTSMFTRGGESDYNLVLVDGVRVNISGGQFDFSRIGTGEVERIEVLRGAQSALWGSDAMGSVVQVFTKRAVPGQAPLLGVSMEGGSFETFRGDARIIGSVRNILDYQAGTTQRQTNGAFADILPEDDRFTQRAADAALGLNLGPRANLRASLRKSYADGRSVGPITFGARDTGTFYNTQDLSWNVRVSHAIGNRFSGTGTVNYFRYGNETADTIADPAFSTYAVLAGTPNALFPNGTRLVRLIDRAEFDRLVANGALPAPGQFLGSRASSDFPNASNTQFRRPAFRYQGDYVWGGNHRLSAGYEWEQERNALDDAVQNDNNAVFVQQQFNISDRWFAAIGGRVDSRETYDTFFSPKLSAGGFVVPFREGTVSSVKVFGNAGRGIKSPTFGERFGGAFTDPAPDLEVELARSTDIGVEATFLGQRLRGQIVYFDNAYTDQIAYRPGLVGDGIPEFVNIDGSEAHGWEIEAALQRPFHGLTALATYAYVDTRVVTNISTSQQFQPGQPLLRRPRHSGTIRATYTLGRADVFFNMRIVGDRHDNSFLSLQTVPNAERPSAQTTDITINPGYVVAGLGVDYRVHETLTVFLRGDNVGDTRYDSALGYPALPRAVVFGGRLRWSVGR